MDKKYREVYTNQLSSLEPGFYSARNSDGKMVKIERTKGHGWTVKTPTHDGWWEVVFYDEAGEQEGVTYEKETRVTEKDVDTAVTTLERYCTQQGKCEGCYLARENKNCSVSALIHSKYNRQRGE